MVLLFVVYLITKDRRYPKYFIFGLFLQRKTAALQNILFYAWSISIAKDRFAEEFSRDLELAKAIGSHIIAYKKAPDYVSSTVMIT